jgi:hypothetical protein
MHHLSLFVAADGGDADDGNEYFWLIILLSISFLNQSR